MGEKEIMSSRYKDDPEYFNFKVEHYKTQGLSDSDICHNLGISRQTFYKYLKKYKDFYDAYNRGKVEIIEKIESAMYKRALGYNWEEVTQEIRTDPDGNVIEKHIKKVKKHVPADMTACIFLSTNGNNAKYKRNPDLASTGGDDQTIDLEFVEEKTDKK